MEIDKSEPRIAYGGKWIGSKAAGDINCSLKLKIRSVSIRRSATIRSNAFALQQLAFPGEPCSGWDSDVIAAGNLVNAGAYQSTGGLCANYWCELPFLCKSRNPLTSAGRALIDKYDGPAVEGSVAQSLGPDADRIITEAEF